MFYETRSGHGLPHDPFRAIVAPRPIGWMSTIDAEDRFNLAPYSFFNAVSASPPIVGFSSEGMKDSASNAHASGEFVVNLATRPLAEAVNLSSAAVAPDVDEFAMTRLTPVPSRLVSPPRLKESPASLECKVTHVVEIKDIDGGDTGRWFTIGAVVGIHIDERYLRNGLFDMVAAQTIARCGYRDYTEVTALFEMLPPKVPPRPAGGSASTD